MTIVPGHPPRVDPQEVTVGVDHHADTPVAAVIDRLGRHLDHATFDSTPAGYQALIAWACTFGRISVAGVEGTGACGAGLTRAFASASVTVLEVDRPDRKTRRDQGKWNPIDAYAAARAAASGRATGTPKSRTGDDESIRALRVARTGAVRARSRALTQLKVLIITVPDALRSQLSDLDSRRLIATGARLRPTRDEAPTPSPYTPNAHRVPDGSSIPPPQPSAPCPASLAASFFSTPKSPRS